MSPRSCAAGILNYHRAKQHAYDSTNTPQYMINAKFTCVSISELEPGSGWNRERTLTPYQEGYQGNCYRRNGEDNSMRIINISC